MNNKYLKDATQSLSSDGDIDCGCEYWIDKEELVNNLDEELVDNFDEELVNNLDEELVDNFDEKLIKEEDSEL